jgi:hypothetical protein
VSFFYLASPYSKFPHGLEAAFHLACEQAALFVRAGIPVFSPIAHTHPIGLSSGLDMRDPAIWLPFDAPMMAAACGLIMLKAISWGQSHGMRVERETFEAAGKPIIWMEPGALPDLPDLLWRTAQ